MREICVDSACVGSLKLSKRAFGGLLQASEAALRAKLADLQAPGTVRYDMMPCDLRLLVFGQ